MRTLDPTPWIVCGPGRTPTPRETGLVPSWRPRVRALGGMVTLHEIRNDSAELRNPPAVALMRIAGHTRTPTLARAERLERALVSAGTRVLNPCKAKKESAVKWRMYERLRAAGLPVPKAAGNPTQSGLDDLLAAGVRYPIVIRSAESSCGQDTQLAETREEALKLIRVYSAKSPSWMAAEFVGGRCDDGLFRKWRAYVVGDRVDLWEAGMNRGWIVNNARSTDFPREQFIEENRVPRWPRELDAEAVRAAAVLGLSVCTFDIVISPEAGHWFVDCAVGYLFSAPDAMFPPDAAEARRGHFRRVAEWLRAVPPR